VNKNVTVTYDAVHDEWTAENPIPVEPGTTTISWKITLTSASAGEIAFGTAADFQGIVFDPGWPGTPPKGDALVWSTTIEDTLKPGDEPLHFHYTVNALYKADDLSPVAQPISWDPDVEEDPGN